MRAKRSKKYRKIMSTYNLQFSFRTPYQVLCDSNFLRACHSFKMPISKFLENTLHGEAKPYITQCTLTAANEQHQKKVRKGQEQLKGRGDGKPNWLPLPTEVPLRYCRHKNADGDVLETVGEVECLLDLISGQASGNEAPKNKQHYILATAESEAEQQGKRRKGIDLREQARMVPGVPIIYVKRSVMILEELSGASERLIRGVEKEKFKEGLIINGRGTKRKREDDDEITDDEADYPESIVREGGPKVRGLNKAKGPNPLSVMKKKKKPKVVQTSQRDNKEGAEHETAKKKKNRRLRGKKHSGNAEQQDSATAGNSVDSQS